MILFRYATGEFPFDPMLPKSTHSQETGARKGKKALRREYVRAALPGDVRRRAEALVGIRV